MHLWIKGINTDQLSSVRGIGKYTEMIVEAIKQYGKNENLILNKVDQQIMLYPGFSPYQLVHLDKTKINILVIHDLIPLKYPQHFSAGIKGKLIWQQNKLLLKQFQGFITDTEVVKKDIIRLIKIKPEKISVIPAAAKKLYEKRTKSQKIELNYSLPNDYVLYVGDVNWNKNLVNLAKAIQKLNLNMVMVGKALTDKTQINHPWQKDFKQFNDLIKNDKKFTLLGYIPDEDLLTLYQQAKLLLMPSFDEGFGLPWLEASLVSTPVVLGDNPVLQEVAGKAAYFVKPDQFENIVKGIHTVLKKPDKNMKKKQANQVKMYTQKQFVKNLSASLHKFFND